MLKPNVGRWQYNWLCSSTQAVDAFSRNLQLWRLHHVSPEALAYKVLILHFTNEFLTVWPCGWKMQTRHFAGILMSVGWRFLMIPNKLPVIINCVNRKIFYIFITFFFNDAFQYFLDRVQNVATNVPQAVDMTDQEYTFLVRQARVKNYLSGFRVIILVSDSIKISKALANIYKLVLKLSRQAPLVRREDAHRIEFFRHAVIGYSSSHEPLSCVATHQLVFRQLCAEREVSFQLCKKASQVALTDEAIEVLRSHDHATNPINYIW